MGGMGWSFRGQADADWPILPKAGRDEYFDPKWDGETVRDASDRPPKDLGRFKEWRDKAIAFCSDLPSNDFECLAYAQHHGLATRLLDWTHNPLVALYFAVREQLDKDGAVYAYFKDIVVRPEIMPLDRLPEVAVFFPRPVHQRILVQRAFFTVHPRPQMPLQPEPLSPMMREVSKVTENLARLRIPAKAKPMIQRELDDFGINHYVLFPGVDGLSEFVNCGTRRGVTASNESDEEA